MCCGKKRSEQVKAAEAQAAPKPVLKEAAEPKQPSDPAIYFQYVGTLGLTLIGPRSGKQYRFSGPGATLVVDPRDRGALAGVSVLRQVKGG